MSHRLPYDVSRCAPQNHDAKCQACLRWHGLPGQTWGPRTPTTIGLDNSKDAGCRFIPAAKDPQ